MKYVSCPTRIHPFYSTKRNWGSSHPSVHESSSFFSPLPPPTLSPSIDFVHLVPLERKWTRGLDINKYDWCKHQQGLRLISRSCPEHVASEKHSSSLRPSKSHPISSHLVPSRLMLKIRFSAEAETMSSDITDQPNLYRQQVSLDDCLSHSSSILELHQYP
jgi:hypothetical protein